MTAGLALAALALVAAEGEVWEEGERDVLVRTERGAKNKGTYHHYSIPGGGVGGELLPLNLV